MKNSESSSQPLASYSYPFPTHQNGNSGSVPLPTHQNGNSDSAPLPVHSHTDPRLSLNYQSGRDLSTFSPHTFREINQTKPLRWAFEQFELPVVPVAGPSSLQPYSAPPLRGNGNFNFSVPSVLPNGWYPDQATTQKFLGSDFPAVPVAGPSSQPYSAPPPRANSNTNFSVPTAITDGRQPDQSLSHRSSRSVKLKTKKGSKKVAAKVYRPEKGNYLSNRRGNVSRLAQVGKEPYVCDVCGKIYQRSGELQKHNAPPAKPRAKKPKVSDEKYPCKYAHEGCKHSYKSLKDWHYYKHLKHVHGEVVIVSEPVRREMVSTFPESEDEDDCEEHNPVPGPSREPSS
ncbi:uncharacterized protein PGTG_17596 [Puccinia graminis f. sp. tritici CRL 75-36-700-3]|uniref:C2H2-type domain-containing protein n=1 Tax=Puccinia graminis f. sp. tritici (strain CRL 75-36-700-3 / race SCCL) TaxID=418459 RepID=E3L4R7_PUCGT|nr:uncharacterized protein PGTG_17596 [Puccinia graminis f. sp. tritici CRL 75-36-700-3]EFP91542.2 hypothetical protein PGTG_17596 [Puccinia graminis f. sp. tritici CRL 75-36-700-3]